MDAITTFGIILGVIIIAIAIFLFLLFRQVSLWYFKIDERILYQKMQIEASYRILEKLGGDVDWEKIYKSLDNKKK